MYQKVKNILVAAFLFSFAMANKPAAAVNTADYPIKSLNYIICFNPGGESDITARIQEAYLKKYFGKDVIISYKIGGGGSVGWSALVKSKPDGYTIAGHNFPHTILQPLMRGNAGYETLDLKQIYIFESTPNVLVVRQDSPFKTLEDFIKYARENPGVITVGGSASNSANDLGTTYLKKVADIKIVYIPFTGTGDAVPALLGGHVSSLMTFPSMVVRYKDKFHPLAIACEERMEVLADVPTFQELGYDFVEGAYRGVVAPPGTPDDIVRYLADTFDKVMKEPEVVRKMNENGFKIETMGPRQAAEFTKKKISEYKAILEELGLLKNQSSPGK